MLTTSSYDSISNTKYKGMKFKKHQIGLGNNINSVTDIDSSADQSFSSSRHVIMDSGKHQTQPIFNKDSKLDSVPDEQDEIKLETDPNTKTLNTTIAADESMMKKTVRSSSTRNNDNKTVSFTANSTNFLPGITTNNGFEIETCFRKPFSKMKQEAIT